MHIKDTVLKSLAMTNMDPVIIMDQDPLTHSSYATFSEAMIKEKKSIIEARALWKLLIDGFCHQKELNKDAQKEAEAIRNTTQLSTLSIRYATPEPLKSVYQDNFIYFFERITNTSTAKKREGIKENYMNFLCGVIRSTNPELEQSTHKLRALLTISENRGLALWSGGTDLSTFSCDRGRYPPEQTASGSLLDNMPITTLWDLETPFWDIISRTLVSQYTRLSVHIYSHVLGSANALLRRELSLMQKNSIAPAIRWHPVFNYLKDMAEIGVYGRAIIESGRGTDDMRAAAELLIAKLGAANYKADKQAHERVNSDYFDLAHLPFAVDKQWDE